MLSSQKPRYLYSGTCSRADPSSDVMTRWLQWEEAAGHAAVGDDVEGVAAMGDEVWGGRAVGDGVAGGGTGPAVLEPLPIAAFPLAGFFLEPFCLASVPGIASLSGPVLSELFLSNHIIFVFLVLRRR